MEYLIVILCGILGIVVEMYLINFLRNFSEIKASIIMTIITFILLILYAIISGSGIVISSKSFIEIIAFAIISFIIYFITFKITNKFDPEGKLSYMATFDICLGILYKVVSILLSLINIKF